MELTDLYNLMKEEVCDSIVGYISYEGIAIKWEYDSFNNEFDDNESELEHLHRIFEEDLETIEELVNIENCHISDPTIEDTYISFYIEQ